MVGWGQTVVLCKDKSKPLKRMYATHTLQDDTDVDIKDVTRLANNKTPYNKEESWHESFSSIDESEEDIGEEDWSDAPGIDPTDGGKKKFDCQRQKLLFTYPSHIPKKRLYEHMCGISNLTPKFWRAAHEIGTKKIPYEHTHVVLDWGAPYHFRDCRKFDWIYADKGKWANMPRNLPYKEGGRTMHPNIRYINPKRDDWIRVCDYIAKDDIDNADLKSAPSVNRGVQNCKTLGEALDRFCKSPGDAMGVGYLFNNKEKEISRRPPVTPIGWQADFEAYIQTITVFTPTFAMPDDRIPGHFNTWKDKEGNYCREWIMAKNSGKKIPTSADDRKIQVIHDPLGNSGKSKWARSLCMREPTKWLYLPGLGDEKDIANIIRKQVDRGWNGHGIFIDMARTKADYKSTYATIERIREGCINATKYDSDILEWDSTIVCMLSNWMPDLLKLSVDRWEIFTIRRHEDCGQFGDLEYLPLTEAMFIYKDELIERKKEIRKKEEMEEI